MVLEAKGICVEFPGVRALEHVDFQLIPGEIYALVEAIVVNSRNFGETAADLCGDGLRSDYLQEGFYSLFMRRILCAAPLR